MHGGRRGCPLNLNLMGGDFFSGGVIIVVAAVLWFVYLVPTWAKRRKFMATERNAVRLQQTLRVLVETNDVPSEVRLEEAAREAAAQAKDLKTREAIRKANVRANLRAAKRRARTELVRLGVSGLSRVIHSRGVRSRGVHSRGSMDPARIRRLRARCTFLSLGSLVLSFVGVAVVSGTGNAAALAIGLMGLAVGVSGTVALVRVGAQESSAASTAVRRPVVVPQRSSAPTVSENSRPVQRREWTPTPLPKPLYHRTAERAPLRTSLDTSFTVATPVERTAPVSPISAARTVAVSARRPDTTSAYADMGIIDEADLGATDLDAIFRQRRAAS